ncbi:hypothetical protein HMPREF1990_00481 [Porphyromonas gingivalis W4087]|uniref:Uncharacterized protein n=1 Tax=Porphyromonas gingivalis F0570 TaxID=1227271 RepID=A0A0E2LQ94_PORGN|nr:hypothetical protein HMPREF1555_01483 [Porphyromonas gingivalis F0570]ERJ67161.1 hypothetical protein HMPREF1554_01105 [Porphyromonas gingivalis F0569]ERJ90765.1 hypothetical protein HMPREF1990_00481 [Porphyromonas gingivalis W4087]
MRKNLPNPQIKCNNPQAEASTNSKQLRQKSERESKNNFNTAPLYN